MLLGACVSRAPFATLLALPGPMSVYAQLELVEGDCWCPAQALTCKSRRDLQCSRGLTLRCHTRQNLESEQLDSELLEPQPVPSARVAAPAQAATAAPARAQAQAQAQALPSVPQSRPAAARPAKTAEEEELEALEKEMAA